MKNKKLWLKLGIFALSIGWIGLSFASAALFNVEITSNGAVYAKKNIIPIHFADNWNDFGGFIYISNMDEISKGETEDPNAPVVDDDEILGDRYYIWTWSTPAYECRAKVKGFYYNSERWERLWPLDEDSASISSNVPTTWWVYTLCRVTWYAQKACGCQWKVYSKDAEGCVCYNNWVPDGDGKCPDLPQDCGWDTECEEIKELSEKDPEICMKEISEEHPEVEGFFGQVEHSFSGQTFGLVMGTTYGHDPLDDYKWRWYSIEKNSSNIPVKLQSSFILWGKRIPIGFVYDYNGWLWFAWCEVTGRSTVPTLTKADTLDILVGSGNEGLLWDLFEGSGQSLVPKSDSPIASGLNCDKIGSMWDSLIHLLIEWLVGMNRNSDYSKVWAQSDTKMQYFSSSDINSATLLNYAKQRSEILCRGKWKKDLVGLDSTSDDVVCLDATNINGWWTTIDSSVTLWAKNAGKTLIIKNTRKETPVNVVIDPFTDSNDATYYDMFINGWNLIVNETDSTDKFVFNVWWFIAEGETSQTYEQKVGIDAINNGQVYKWDLAARASLIRWNFVVDWNIKGLPGADGILKNKYFIYWKFTTKDSFKDLEKTFRWNCNTDSGRASDKLPSGEYSYCPVSVEEEWYYNPYYNVSLVVIDQDYDSPLFM